ncbi:hypothetical protein Tco_1397448, partial [Tanacetum coccineum]
ATKASKSQQPKPAPAKPQEKKRKLVTETSEAPSPAKLSKAGKVIKKRKPKSSLQMIDEFVDEGVLDKESGPLPPVVIREPDSGKSQPLPDVQENGKEKVMMNLLNLSQPQSSHAVLAGPNREHMDFEENLKLPTEDQVRLEEPASSAGTLSSLQNLDKELSFADQFLVEKSQEDEPEKTNTESEVQSMVTVPIHQDTSYVPLMTTPVIDLTVSQPISIMVQAPLPTSITTVTSFTTTTSLPPPPPQLQQGSSDLILIQRISELEQHMADLVSKAGDEIVTNAVDWAIQAPLRDHFRDLPEADMKEILHHRMWETKSYEAHEDHKKLYEALEKSMNHDHSDQFLTDLAEARRKKKRRHESPKTPPRSPPHQPPPPPPPVAAPSSLKTSTLAEYTAWTTTDTRLKPFVSSILEDLHMDADSAPDEQVHSSDDEDIGNDHIPKRTRYLLRPVTWQSLWTGSVKSKGSWNLHKKDLEGPAFEIVKVFQPNVIHLQYQMEECHRLLTDQVDDAIIRYNVSKPLPLGGQPGQVTIQVDFFFNKDLEYLRYGSKSGRPALSISKMKAAYYPDVGLEQMVPDQMWIEEECKQTSEGDRRAVRTHMRILSVVRIEVFSLYGYDYMKTIVLRRADLKYIIAERDFKYMYPSDFEDLYLLNLQGYQNHLPPQDKKILSTAVNLWIRNLDATGFEFKHDFTVIDSPRAVTFRDKYGIHMIMRFNEIQKSSDDTLQQIDEALDYWVKEFK